MGNKITMKGSVVSGSGVGCALKDLEEMITLIFQRYVTLDLKVNRQAYLKERLTFV